MKEGYAGIKIEPVEISKVQFDSYEKVRNGGKTNMLDIRMVAFLSNGILEKEDVREIIKRYTTLSKRYE